MSTAHTPITMRLDDGTHLAFHEAALVDHSALWFKRAEGRLFRTVLSPSSQGPRVVRDLPFNTPWRTIRIADSAASLVENDLELNLNEPNKLGDVSWFKPMKYVGIWWGMIRGDWSWAEGARGMEYNAWGEFANGPDHEPTLVYTRMLSGPMDYTPGILSLEGPGHVPLASTLAKQLGLYLAIYSQIQMAADFVESLAAHPRELEFIKTVPADWAESRLIAGEVGDYAIFARKDRNSEDWYVGGVNDAMPRDLVLTLDFLDPGKTYTASVWKDGERANYLTDARHRIAYESRTVKKGDTFPLWLAPGGGAAIRLHPGK